MIIWQAKQFFVSRVNVTYVFLVGSVANSGVCDKEKQPFWPDSLPSTVMNITK